MFIWAVSLGLVFALDHKTNLNDLKRIAISDVTRNKHAVEIERLDQPTD
jgi:hypothetical protein